MIKITLPMPPSVNVLFAGMKRRFKSKIYKEWSAIVEEILCSEYAGLALDPKQWLGVEIVLFSPLYYKNGNVRRIDVANYEKATTDAIIPFLGSDDCMIISNHQSKRESDRNEVEVTITELGDSTKK